MKLLRFLCSFILCFLFISICFPQTKYVMEDDGTDWMKASEAFKVGYIGGFISGLGVAELELFTYENLFEDKILRNSFKNDIEKINFYNITIGQLKDGIDVFYKDFSNRRIKIIDAIYIVKMQIEGKNQDLINAQIRYLKMQPISLEAIRNSIIKWGNFFDKNKRFPTYQEIKNGDFSFEDLIKDGKYVDVNDKIHFLFCYGEYK